MATDLNSGMLGKTFKTASLAGFGALGNNADTLRGFVMQDPALLEKVGGEQALNDYIKQHQQALSWNPETGGEFRFSDQTKKIDELLSGYQMNSVGYAGIDDGRAKAIVKDGQTLYAGDPYSYKPAKDNLKTAITGVALIGATAGLSALVNSAGSLFGTAGGTMPGASGATGAAGGAAGSASSSMLQGLPALAGDFGAVSASSSAFDAVLSLTGSEALAGVAGKAGFALDAIGGAAGASGASGGGGWLSNTWSAITGGVGGGSAGGSLLGSLFGGSSILRDLLPIIGAGVIQYSSEKMADDQRDWLSAEKQKDRDFEEKKASDTRRRQMPTTGPGLLGKFRVIPGAGNGG